MDEKKLTGPMSKKEFENFKIKRGLTMRYLTISFIMAAAVISALSYFQATADDWPCPCYTVYCENNVIVARFCLPDDEEDGYWFHWRTTGTQDDDSIELTDPEEVHSCPTGCDYYGTEVPWPCVLGFDWWVTIGEDGDEIEFYHNECE